MKDFEERQRILFRSHLRTNLAEFSKTSDAVMTILSTRSLVGRHAAQTLTQSLTNARKSAWAAISVNLHNQLTQLAKETVGYVGTQLGIPAPDNVTGNVDLPILGRTLPSWLASAEALETARVLKAMRRAYSLSQTALAGFQESAPYSMSNSTVSAITVTAATSVINRTALDLYRAAGVKQYRLETSGEIREPHNYQHNYGVDHDPVAPMWVGDRSYPVPA